MNPAPPFDFEKCLVLNKLLRISVNKFILFNLGGAG